MSKSNHYNWEGVRYGTRRKSPTSDPLIKWILIALLLAILCHLVVLVAMQKMPIFFQPDDEEILTQSVVVRNVDEKQYINSTIDDRANELEPPSEAVEVLLEELEMLEDSPEDIDIDFSPEIDATDISVPIEAPAMAGQIESSALDLTSGLDMSEIIEDLGSTDDFLQPAIGQITVDPGKQSADEFDPDLFNIELARGADGEDRNGVLEGFTPLEEMTRLSQSDLAKATGMIGSDLLFEFNKSTLRESAKNSLLKVVLLIDKNPNMMCWIEGHTDLIGSDEANVILSIARAEAVRDWLVNSMKISESRLFVRGLGESQPIILEGDQNAQAINRRVEIKMRNEKPPTYDLTPSLEVKKKPRIIKPLRNPNLAEAVKGGAVDDRSEKKLPKEASSSQKNINEQVPRALSPLPKVTFREVNATETAAKLPTDSAPLSTKVIPKAVPILEPEAKGTTPNVNPIKEPAKAVLVEESDNQEIPRAVPIPESAPQLEKIPPRAIPVE